MSVRLWLSDGDYRDSLYTDWVIDWLVVAEACRGAWAEIDGCLCRQLLLNWLQWPQLLLACDVAATAVIASFFSSSTVSWLFRIRSKCFFCRATPYQRGTCCRLVSVCLSVRPSQAGIVPKRLDGQSWFFCELPLTYPELFVRKFGHLKNKGTSLWNFTPNAGLRENFATASRWCDQQNSSTVEPVDYVYGGPASRVWMHIVYYTSVDCNPLTPLPLFWICCATRSYTVVQQLAKFCLTHRVARSISDSRASCVILEKKCDCDF